MSDTTKEYLGREGTQALIDNVKNLVGSGSGSGGDEPVICGSYVNITGDTMTGTLNIQNGNLNVYDTPASGADSHQMHFNSDTGAFAVGESGVNSDYAVAEGKSNAYSYGSHSEGASSAGNNTDSASRYNSRFAHAEGDGAIASNRAAHAEGLDTTASGFASHAEGSYTTASGQYSHAEGHHTTAAYDHQHVSGKYNNNKSTNLLEVGNGSVLANSNAFEVTADGDIVAGRDVIDGYGNKLSTGGGSGLVSGSYVNITGDTMTGALTIGSSPSSSDASVYDKAFEINTPSSSYDGYGLVIKKNKNNYFGISLGFRAKASKNSIAMGENTEASGDSSFAHGSGAVAESASSHAEGTSTNAVGLSSHAEGYNTSAIGARSHTNGTGTYAGYDNQFIAGKYNNNKSTNLLEVGNGTDSSHKSNAFEVASNGDITAGKDVIDGYGNKLSAAGSSATDIAYTIYDERVQVLEGYMKKIGNLCIASMRVKILKSLTTSQTSLLTVPTSICPACITYGNGWNEASGGSFITTNLSLAGNINIFHNGNVLNNTVAFTMVWYAGGSS